MSHYFPNVPGIGNIAVSRHAQARMLDDGIPQDQFEAALLHPTREMPDGQDVIWRERNGVRVVILTNPIPNRGAKLVKTVYRIKPQAAVLR
jgi:hypothetical protein